MRHELLKRDRSGVALLIVLIVIAMLALSAYTFCDLMIAEKEAAVLTGRQVQAKMLVDSGVDQIRLFLELPEQQRLDAGGAFNNTPCFKRSRSSMVARPKREEDSGSSPR